MNVWIDIIHTPQFNFYRPLIGLLEERGIHVYVTVLDRGRLARIVKKELADLKNVEVYIIGRRRMNKFSVIVEANILRIPRLILWALNKHIDVSLSNGFHNDIVGKLFRFPCYNFGDDPQAPANKWTTKLSTSCYCLVGIKSDQMFLRKDDIFFPSLKEWACLSPAYFSPNMAALERYGLTPKSYIILREVSVSSLNYSNQAPNAIYRIIDQIPDGLTVLLSLEEKDKRTMYPSNWILLEEPVNDIHSLIYYSSGLVSSGDSMAREAALLGVPAYYLGIRTSMPSNRAAAKVANLSTRETASFEEWTGSLLKPVEDQIAYQERTREGICANFSDITAFMLRLVMQYEK